MTSRPTRDEAGLAEDERQGALVSEVMAKEPDPRKRAAEYERLIRSGELVPLDAEGLRAYLDRHRPT